MDKTLSYYQKRENRRRLERFSEYRSIGFSMGADALLGAALLVFSFDLKTRSFSGAMLAVAALYLVMAGCLALLQRKMQSDILKTNDIRQGTRLAGIPMLLTIAAGNLFAALAGFQLLKKEKSVEYTLCSYMVIVQLLVILVSSLNVFKDYVTNSFFLGIGLMSGLLVFYVLALILVGRFTTGQAVDKKMIILAVPLILSSLSGNLFALLVGIILISRAANREPDVSVEWVEVIKRLCRNQMALLGCFIVIFLISISVCSNLTFDYDVAVSNNYSALLQPPSLKYPFGTDDFGRCVFTRVVFGARISLLVGILSTALSIIVGVVLGALAGYYSNAVDNGIMRVLDIFQAIPGLLLPIAIITAFGTSIPNIILALGVGVIPGYARTARATVMTLTGSEFVEAAKACGVKESQIIFRHILPNSLAPIIVRATMSIGSATLAVSALSYLGLGIDSHIPEWGNILRTGSTYLETNPYLAIYPGLAIILLVLAFNFLGDGLRDAMDPKLK